VQNYQSHKHSKLKFKDGLNVIVGSSNSGKSSILRAINTVINNKFVTDNFIRKDQDNFKNIIEIEDKEIIREKGKNVNKYVVDDVELKAFNRSVPDEVQSVTNFDSINMQSQFDKHFLLSESSGEVARVLNKIIKLDNIDKTLYNIESKRRSCKKEIEKIENNIQVLEDEIEQYDWVEKADSLLQKAELLNEKLEGIIDKIESLHELYDAIVKEESNVERCNKILDQKSVLIDLQEMNKMLLEKSDKKNELLILQTSILGNKEKIKECDSILSYKSFLSDLIKDEEQLKNNNQKLSDLKEFQLYEKSISKYKTIIVNANKELKEKLKDGIVCPVTNLFCNRVSE